jgi:hypothetical protein
VRNEYGRLVDAWRERSEDRSEINSVLHCHLGGDAMNLGCILGNGEAIRLDDVFGTYDLVRLLVGK